MFFQSVQPIMGGGGKERSVLDGAERSGIPTLEGSGGAKTAKTAPNRDTSARRPDAPIDLNRLARHCLGDRELENELLRLFRLQSQALIAELADPSLLSLESKANIVHKMRGSAAAVGAWRVAEAALALEELAFSVRAAHSQAEGTAAEAGAIAALLEAASEAVADIERILGLTRQT